MKIKNLCLNLIKEDKIIYRIYAYLEYDENNDNDEGEITFRHPMTGEKCTNVSDCLVGWSEMTDEDNNIRNILVDMVSEDTDLMQKAWDVDLIPSSLKFSSMKYGHINYYL